MKKLTPRFYYLLGVFALIIAGACAVGWYYFHAYRCTHNPIKIGVIHALTGDFSSLATPLVKVITMAVEEINAQGGVLGRPVEIVLADGKSDPLIYEEKSEELIKKDHVVALFGGWQSSARKLMIKVAEKENILFFHAVSSEGLEESQNLVMTGSLPNQTIVPAVTWAFYNLGKRFYLIGDNEIFGQTVGEIVCGQIDFLGGELAGQTYVSADPVEIATAVEEIKAKMPSVIVNFLDGEHNKVFFQKLRAAGVTHAIIPTVCYSLNETEIVEYGVDLMIGDYSVVNYYQTLESPENISFIERFTKKYGSSDVINDTMQASYDNVYLWARAVEKAGTTATDSVRKAIKTIAVNGPGGIIYLGQNLYAWLNAFIAQIRYDGKFDIVWSSKATMTPEPFLPYKSKEEWKAFLDGWYKKWGNRWEPK